MRLSSRVHVVGSGAMGFDLTDPFDCHVYLIDGGDELALVDAGAGMGAEAILANVRAAKLDPARIRHLILTHGHGGHAGEAPKLRRLQHEPLVYASAISALALRNADEKALSLDVAKRAGIYPDDYTLEPCPIDVELEAEHLRLPSRPAHLLTPEAARRRYQRLAARSSDAVSKRW